MRALVVAPQPFFTPRGTPFSVYYRTMVTADMGISVDLLTYGQGEDVDIPGVRIVRIPRVPCMGPVRIGPSLPKLLLDVLMTVWTLGLLVRRRYDVVHAHEEAVFWCRFLKPLFRFRLVYDMHSSLPQQLTNFEFTRSRLLIGLFDRLERSALRSADAVITIAPELARQAESLMDEPDRHVLIENSIFDTVRRRAGEAPEEPQSWPELPKDRPVVAYIGTFEAYQGLDLLIEGFAQLRQQRPDSFLLLVGGTPEQVAEHRSLAAQHGVDEASLFTGRVPQAQAKRYLEAATVVTSPRSTGTNTPLKVYELIASGVPIVATRILSHTQVLDDDVCFLVEPNPDAIAEGLRRALEDPEAARAKATAARALYRDRYSRDAYEEKMRRVMRLVGWQESA